jgi:Cu-Zn family superoxide dismutase
MIRAVLGLSVALLLSVGLVLPGGAQPRAQAVARLSGLDGKPVGTADFRAVNGGVLIVLDLGGLAPGAHGLHLHASGHCDAKSGFTKAGPILSLRPGRRHGYLAKGGPMTGDLPNQFAGADGRLKASIVTNAFTLGNGKRSIFDRDGVALIVNKRGDDYRTQPIGNAGDRIACGVVVRTRGPAPRPVFKPAPKPSKNAGP